MKLYTLIALSTFLVFILKNTCVKAQSQTILDLQTSEGDTNVFIPCQFSGGTIPFWKINDTFYHHTRLPCPFVLSTAPNGIRIPLIDRSINGISFQCFSSRNGIIMAGGVVLLIVRLNSEYAGNGGDTPDLTLDLIYQQTRFTQSDITLSWGLFNKNDNSIENSPLGSRSVVYTSDCDVSNASTTVNTTDMHTVLSRGDYGNDFFGITTFNVNMEMIGTFDEPIRISTEVETGRFSSELFIGRTCPACIPVPEPTQAPFFNVPRSLTSNQRDSLCRSVRTPDESGRCVDLSQSCPDFPSSPFSSSVTVCTTTSTSTDYQLCLSNLTREMNGTKIHFMYSTQPICPITQNNQRQSLIIASYEIIAQESNGNVSVTTNTSSGELCLVSLPRGCYTTTVYNITISNVIGSSIYTDRNVKDDVCTQVDLLQTLDSVCAPYTIAVDAYNPVPHSVNYQTVYHTIGEDLTRGSFCDCARGKVTVELDKPTLSGIDIKCNSNADRSIQFSIEAIDMDSKSKAFSSQLISCATNPKTIPISNLACNREYSVSAHFTFRNGTVTDCLLSNTSINIFQECLTTIAPTPSPTTSSVVIIVPVVIVVVVITVILLVIIILLVYKYKRNSGVYRPSHRERQQSGRPTALGTINNTEQTEDLQSVSTRLNNEIERNEL